MNSRYLDAMRQITTADLALSRTAQITLFGPEHRPAHTLTARVNNDVITISGDDAAAQWIVEQEAPDQVRAAIVRDGVNTFCALREWMLRRVDLCPACTHNGTVLDTWWTPIDAVIGAQVATVHGQGVNSEPPTVTGPDPDSWQARFYADVADWLNRTLPQRWPESNYKQVATVLSVDEELEFGFGGSDVTAPDNPKVDLTLTWLDVDGDRQTLVVSMLMTELMNELT